MRLVLAAALTVSALMISEGLALGADGAIRAPYHKLSQWLTYSLLEPFEWGGVKVHGTDRRLRVVLSADYERLEFLRVLRSHELQPITDPGALIAPPPAPPEPEAETGEGSQPTADPAAEGGTGDVTEGSPGVESGDG